MSDESEVNSAFAYNVDKKYNAVSSSDVVHQVSKDSFSDVVQHNVDRRKIFSSTYQIQISNLK